jgi:hypothetical protein
VGAVGVLCGCVVWVCWCVGVFWCVGVRAWCVFVRVRSCVVRVRVCSCVRVCVVRVSFVCAGVRDTRESKE